MLNLNPDDINSVGKTIGSIIFIIIIFIGIVIILDEIFHISKFCFKYTYLYNYGKLNENICKKDANSLIEFETSRFRLYNELNNYKFHKDIFNKNWINYAVFISISIITILACFAFGYLFFHFFIANNDTCEFNIDEGLKTNDPRISFLNRLLECIGAKQKLPNCTYNYFIFYIIVLVYPLIYLLKFFFKIDYTYWNNKLLTKIFHIFVLINLLYYLFILFMIDDKEDTWNITKLTVFISFMIVFYLADYIYNQSYDEYYNLNKGINIYSGNKTIVGILNKYFNFAKEEGEFNRDDNRDVNFFEIYKQEEPERPKAVEKPTYSNMDLLTNFRTCRTEDFQDPKNTYCYQFSNKDKQLNEYQQHKRMVDDYYKNKEDYEKNLNIYNFKLNIYKNNKVDFPEFVSLLRNMIPALLGFNKTSHQYLFILLIIIAVLYHLLKVNKKTKFSVYVYNTIFIYVIAVLSILVLSNAILTYNTYANKYLIYEPIAYYKEDITNLDALFNALLNKDTNKGLSDNYIDLYNGLNGNKLNKFSEALDSSKKTSSEKIKELMNMDITSSNLNNFSNSYQVDMIKPTEFSNIRNQILRVLYTDFFNISGTLNATEEIGQLSSGLSSTINSNYITSTPSFYTYTSASSGSSMKSDLRTFFINVKNIFIEDPKEIDVHIQKIKMNLVYLIYNDKYDIPSSNNDFYNLFVKYPSKDELNKIDKTKTSAAIALYLNNINHINKIFEYYKQFLLKFRSLMIELFNSAEIYCENDDSIININTKLNTFLNKLFENNEKLNIDFNRQNYFNDYNYITTTEDLPKVNLYKKIMELYITKIGNEYLRFFNIIKVIYGIDLVDTNDKPNKLEYNIINNYNFFNKDTRKHTLDNLIRNPDLIVKVKNNLNKYSSYDTNKILKLNLSINNVAWSFVILMIIFAIFLIEPIIIQS